jgi:hypothetical protein
MPTGRSAIGLDSFDIETEAMQGPANETAAGQLVLDTRMHLDAACQRKHPAESPGSRPELRSPPSQLERE